MSWWVYFAAMFSTTLFSHDIFHISEIFGNSLGKGRDESKEWIELTNLTTETLSVTNIKLEIFTGNELKKVFSASREAKLDFKNNLIIAQHENLGLDRCLRKGLPLVVIEDFRIANDQAFKICVSINSDVTSCAFVSKKIKMADGVSLYREDIDHSDQPLWRHEPCRFTEEMFASPFLENRYCRNREMSTKALFGSCESEKEALSPRPVNQGVIVNAFLTRTCAAPQHSEKICHVLDERLELKKDSALSTLSSWDRRMGPKIFSETEDLANGRKKYRTAIENKPDDEIPNFSRSKVELAHVSKTETALMLTLDKNDLPANVALIVDDEIVEQKAFLMAGQKRMHIPFRDSGIDHVVIHLSNVRGNMKVKLQM